MSKPFLEPVAPTQEEIQLAEKSRRCLAALLDRRDQPLNQQRLDAGSAKGRATSDSTVAVQIAPAEPSGESLTVALPASSLPLLARLLDELAQGHAVVLLPVETELSPQQAADLLNVSRPFFMRLLESGEIPSRKVGTHHRVLLRDVLAFKRRDEERRHAIADELTAQAQELNMGY